MKQYLPGIIAAVLITAGFAYGGAIKSWSNNEVLSPTDLNANFSHIHGTMVGGHGARLVNSDVSTSAAIAHTKMATPALLPKAWAYVASTCTSDPCTRAASSGISAVNWVSAGNYTATLSYTPADNAFGVLLTGHAQVYCWMSARSVAAPHITFSCDNAAGVQTNAGFTILVMDNL